MKSKLLISVAIVVALAAFICFLPGYKPAAHPYFAGQEAGHVEILAHGAGQGVAPTNTLAALKQAHSDGADILEIDVQLTKDNQLVLQHDDTLERTTDLAGRVADRTWAQIVAADKGAVTLIGGRTFSGDDTKVALLDTALAAFPTARWNIEIKNDSPIAAQQLCQSIRRAVLTRQVLVPSFHDRAMAEFRRQCPEVATSMAPNEIRMFVIAAHLRLARFVKTPAVAVQVPVSAGGFDLTNPRFIAALKARNIKLHYWTINEPAQMRQLIDAGADGILTDFVVRGREVRQRAMREPRPSRP